MEALEKVEHRPILVLTKATREMNRVVGRDPDEVLIEGSMVNRTEAQPVPHDRFSVLLHVSDDVRGIEKTQLFQPADRTLAAVRRDDPAPDTSLVQTNARLANDIATLEWIHDRRRRWVVHRTD
jgi:hypothetical protein